MIQSTHDAINKATGGGFPKGRVTAVYGPPGGGKSGLALSVCATALSPTWVDKDGSLDQPLARHLGIGQELSIVDYGATSSVAVATAEQLAASGSDLIVFDPLFICPPRCQRPLIELAGRVAGEFQCAIIMVCGDVLPQAFIKRSALIIEMGLMKEGDNGEAKTTFRTIKNFTCPAYQYGELCFSLELAEA